MNDPAEVIIIGAGPVGATAALLLASHGIRCVVLERRNAPQQHPAAHVLSTRTLEIWREIGLEQEVLRLSAPLHELRTIVYCTTLAGPELGRVPLLDLPADRLDDIESLSPTRAAHFPQNRLEPLLWERLRRCEGVDFRPGHAYESHSEHRDSIDVRVRDQGEGRARNLSARYLIAADGAVSPVRRALGVGMHGPVLQHVISVHFSADLERYRRSRRGPVIWTYTPKGLGTIIVHRQPDDLVFQLPYFPPYQSLDDFTPQLCREYVRAAIGDPSAEVTIRSIQPWTMTAQVAPCYRSGRVFLAGDAAHRFPPTGGLGLNTGVHDAHNLAWKLAWVLRGRADPFLLDTYERERRPVGQACTEHSVANFDGVLDVLASLGLPRRMIRRLPVLLAAPQVRRLPRRAMRTALLRGNALALRRLRWAASPGRIGERTRRRAAAAIAGQGGHYRSWGLDLGTRYHEGLVVPDGLPETAPEIEFYTPAVRSGGRLPHAWIENAGQRHSTLDLLTKDRLTLLISAAGTAVWPAAAAALPIGVRQIADETVWTSALGQKDLDGLLVRPDGHIAALIPHGPDPVAELERTLTALSTSPPGRTP